MCKNFLKKNVDRKVSYYIFRPYITKNGVRYYAKDYGKKAFRIPVYR